MYFQYVFCCFIHLLVFLVFFSKTDVYVCIFLIPPACVMFANAAPKSLALFRGWMPPCITLLFYTPLHFYTNPPPIGGWMPGAGKRRLQRDPTIQSAGRVGRNWGINRANGPFNIERQFLHIMPRKSDQMCSCSF